MALWRGGTRFRVGRTREKLQRISLSKHFQLHLLVLLGDSRVRAAPTPCGPPSPHLPLTHMASTPLHLLQNPYSHQHTSSHSPIQIAELFLQLVTLLIPIDPPSHQCLSLCHTLSPGPYEISLALQVLGAAEANLGATVSELRMGVSAS